MQRTDEQRVADQALTDAIERVISLGRLDADGADITQEYVVLAAQQRLLDDGELEHSFVVLYRDGNVPFTHAIGLLHAALDTLRSERSGDE